MPKMISLTTKFVVLVGPLLSICISRIFLSCVPLKVLLSLNV